MWKPKVRQSDFCVKFTYFSQTSLCWLPHLMFTDYFSEVDNNNNEAKCQLFIPFQIRDPPKWISKSSDRTHIEGKIKLLWNSFTRLVFQVKHQFYFVKSGRILHPLTDGQQIVNIFKVGTSLYLKRNFNSYPFRHSTVAL